MRQNAIWTLISLQIKAGVKLPRGKNRFNTIIKWLIIFSVGIILLGTFIALYYLIARQFVGDKGGTQVDLSTEFLVFTIAGFQIIQTLFLIPLLLKVLDINNDRELLLKLPVSSRQIFISKIIVSYIYEVIFATIILLPILLSFGIASGMSFVFYLLIPILILFVPALPFCLAILVLFPVMKIAQYLRTRSFLTTIVYLAMLVGAVMLYMYLIQNMVFAVADKGFRNALDDSALSIKNIAKYLYPARFFAKILNVGAGTALLNVGGILLSSIILMGIALVVAGLKYKKFYLTERITGTKPAKKSAYSPKGTTWSVLDKDVKNIFRSSNYTFQFLIVVVITPFIIYFSNRLASYAAYQAFNKAGQVDSALQIVFEVSLLVTMVLVPLSSSFAASNISREGWNIYHTKLIPVSFRKQILIKTGIVFIPIFISVLTGCCLTMIKFKTANGQPAVGLSASEAFMLFAITIPMVIGYICTGTYLDIRKPVCNQVGGGELTKSTSHTNFIIIFGVLMGLGFGAMAFISSFASAFRLNFNPNTCRIILLAISIAFAAASAALLFIDGPKRYRRLEQ